MDSYSNVTEAMIFKDKKANGKTWSNIKEMATKTRNQENSRNNFFLNLDNVQIDNVWYLIHYQYVSSKLTMECIN